MAVGEVSRRRFLEGTAAALAGIALGSCGSSPLQFKASQGSRILSNLELILQNSGVDRYLDIMTPHAVIGNRYSYLANISFEGEPLYIFYPSSFVPSWFGGTPQEKPACLDAVTDLTCIKTHLELIEFLDLQKRVKGSHFSSALAENRVIVPAPMLRQYDKVSYQQRYTLHFESPSEAPVAVDIPASEFDPGLRHFGGLWKSGGTDVMEYMHTTPSLVELAGGITAGLSSDELRAQALLDFVQSFGYFREHAQMDIPRFPQATLMAKGGDCEDTSGLYATLLSISKIKAKLIEYQTHVMVGVTGNFRGHSFDHRGNKCFYAETTGESHRIGDDPQFSPNQIIRIRDISYEGRNG